MKAVLSNPARLASSRLPGKMLSPMGPDRVPMLALQVERLRRSRYCELVMALRPQDTELVSLSRAMGVRIVWQTEGDLIRTHADVMRQTDADVLLLTGADDPFLEPSTVDAVCSELVATAAGFTKSVGFPLGMNTWAWWREGMEAADAEATAKDERIHVAPWFERRPDRYPPAWVTREPDLYDLRLTVDFPEDVALVDRIFTALWPIRETFDLYDILDVLDAHPEWLDLNAMHLHGITARDAIYDIKPVESAKPTTRQASDSASTDYTENRQVRRSQDPPSLIARGG